jgi:hypothetical protein
VLRPLIRRPLLSAAALIAVVTLSGAGYAAGSISTVNAEKATFALDAAALRAGEQQAAVAAAEQKFQRDSAEVAEADRAARRAAAQEAARQAQLEAERQAQLEAERQAVAARQAAAEEASRSAARDPRSAARAMLGEFGWGQSQFGCLDTLWQRESGWDPAADNPTSSAYGIPQALPGSKMASAGADWQTNPLTQMRWGLGYIDSRYGSPCGALEHSERNNWY